MAMRRKPVGWRFESRRHSLASRGVKTAIPKSEAMMKLPVQKTEKQRAIDSIDKISKSSGIPKKELRKYLVDDVNMTYEEATARDKILTKFEEINDIDDDGVPNHLDCEPLNPKKQGFFDGIKKGVQKVKTNQEIKTQEQYWKREKKLSDLKQQLEAKEDALNKKKEQALLKEQTQVEEKKAIAQIKLKEKELNVLQKELEKDTFKGTAKEVGRAFRQEALSLIKEDRKKTTKKTISKEKIALTNTKKEIKKLKNREIAIKRKLTILRNKAKK